MDIEIYTTEDGRASVDVKVEQETVWLSLNQLAILFKRDKSVISRHITNIYKTNELPKKATVAKFATVQFEGKRQVDRTIEHYNLDVIISVGYRVNSKQGVRFRQWASKVVKNYLIQGYSLNHKRLINRKADEIQKSIELLSRVLQQQSDIGDVSAATISIIREFSKTWHVLLQYDENTLELLQGKKVKKRFNLKEAQNAVEQLKLHLQGIGEASELFGIDKEGDGLSSILSNIEQSFNNAPLYPTLEMRAAHLLYFIIKDHPFVDGNKRVGCLLFMLYAKVSRINLVKINDVSLTALALLIAESNPAEKELIIKLIINLIC